MSVNTPSNPTYYSYTPSTIPSYYLSAGETPVVASNPTYIPTAPTAVSPTPSAATSTTVTTTGTPEKEPEKKKSKKGLYIGLIVLAIVVVVIILLAVGLSGSSSAKANSNANQGMSTNPATMSSTTPNNLYTVKGQTNPLAKINAMIHNAGVYTKNAFVPRKAAALNNIQQQQQQARTAAQAARQKARQNTMAKVRNTSARGPLPRGSLDRKTSAGGATSIQEKRNKMNRVRGITGGSPPRTSAMGLAAARAIRNAPTPEDDSRRSKIANSRPHGNLNKELEEEIKSLKHSKQQLEDSKAQLMKLQSEHSDDKNVVHFIDQISKFDDAIVHIHTDIAKLREEIEKCSGAIMNGNPKEMTEQAKTNFKAMIADMRSKIMELYMNLEMIHGLKKEMIANIKNVTQHKIEEYIKIVNKVKDLHKQMMTNLDLMMTKLKSMPLIYNKIKALEMEINKNPNIKNPIQISKENPNIKQTFSKDLSAKTPDQIKENFPIMSSLTSNPESIKKLTSAINAIPSGVKSSV